MAVKVADTPQPGAVPAEIVALKVAVKVPELPDATVQVKMLPLPEVGEQPAGAVQA